MLVRRNTNLHMERVPGRSDLGIGRLRHAWPGVRSGDSTLGRTFLGVRSGDRTLLRPLVLSIHNSTMPVQVRSGDWTLLRPPIPFIHNHISRLQVRTRPELHSITPNHNSIVPLFHFEVFHKPHSLSDPPIWQGGLSLDFHYRCGYIEHRKVW